MVVANVGTNATGSAILFLWYAAFARLLPDETPAILFLGIATAAACAVIVLATGSGLQLARRRTEPVMTGGVANVPRVYTLISACVMLASAALIGVLFDSQELWFRFLGGVIIASNYRWIARLATAVHDHR